MRREQPLVGTEAEQEAELASLQAYFDVDHSKEGHICVHASALPTILYHYEDTLAEESESSSKGRHAPTRQAGLSEMLCVVGRLLLRKVLTSYQSSLEEEQNQQLLVRLVLSHFQAQSLERQAQHNMDSLLEEDSTPAKTNGASKRKLKKDRRLKRQELADEAQAPWDEEQELQLLTQMGWSKCEGSTCGACGASAEQSHAEPAANGPGASAAGGASADAQPPEPLEPIDPNSQPALTEEELLEWEAQKNELLEKRQVMRSQLKQRFEEFCER